MSNEALTMFCTILALIVYSMGLPMLLNRGRYEKLADQLYEEKSKTYGLELDVKYLKQDVQRLEKLYWESRK